MCNETSRSIASAIGVPADWINNALSQRGMMPMDGYVSCPCCGDTRLDRSDMATAPALEAIYGGRVCRGCEDNHRDCDDCGVPTPSEELACNEALDIRLCEDCRFTDSNGRVQPNQREIWA